MGIFVILGQGILLRLTASLTDASLHLGRWAAPGCYYINHYSCMWDATAIGTACRDHGRTAAEASAISGTRYSGRIWNMVRKGFIVYSGCTLAVLVYVRSLLSARFPSPFPLMVLCVFLNVDTHTHRRQVSMKPQMNLDLWDSRICATL